MPFGQKIRSMKTPSVQSPIATRTSRGITMIGLVLLFLLAVFRLTHLPAAPNGHDFVDLWRGLAVGSLFLFFCVPTSSRPRPGL